MNRKFFHSPGIVFGSIPSALVLRQLRLRQQTCAKRIAMSQEMISVRSLESDIRQGVRESEVLSKYKLTTRQLERLLNRMLKAGHLSDLEVMHWLKMTDSQLMRAFRESSEPQTAIHVSERVQLEKRTIRAKDVVRDIRSHMTDAQLMEKYQLSARGLQSVLKKLIRHKLISESDLEVRPVGYEDTVTIDLRFLIKEK
jgi:uncharacterized protein (DUF433 family)